MMMCLMLNPHPKFSCNNSGTQDFVLAGLAQNVPAGTPRQKRVWMCFFGWKGDRSVQVAYGHVIQIVIPLFLRNLQKNLGGGNSNIFIFTPNLGVS